MILVAEGGGSLEVKRGDKPAAEGGQTAAMRGDIGKREGSLARPARLSQARVG